jgi:MoaA/NifB/PqqE/SkfB family radical SAM enzyme
MEHKVRYMNIGITNRCNLACQMCDIWKEKDKADLSPVIVKDLMDARCLDEKLDITLTGGEPFLHDGLWKITDAILMKDPRWLKGVSTNGTLTKEVLRYLQDFSGRLPADFALHISLDGINSHDEQRGTSIKKVLDTLRCVKSMYPSVQIKIKFTITSVNYKDIIPTFKFCKENGLDFRVKLVEYAKNYTNKQNAQACSLNEKARRAVIADLLEIAKEKRGSRDRNAGFIDAMIFHLLGRARTSVCGTPFQRVFIMPDGKVFSCLHFPSIGNLHHHGLDVLWDSDIAEEQRVSVTRGQCPECVSYHGSTTE